ncbi:MAG TPA: hypothetical protein PLF35_03080 [Prolixibacteraceae bacterium]|nr:hypothetical protein [Prolixibacteraceae bacterium]
MISIDQLEVMLRTVPQYLLFGSLSLYLFGWIERKSIFTTIGEIILLLNGILAIIVLTANVIPSPLTQGVNQQHIEMVIKMLTLFGIAGILALISLIVRFIRKKHFKPLVFIAFAFAVYIFFFSTKISKIKFELNQPEQQIENNSN